MIQTREGCGIMETIYLNIVVGIVAGVLAGFYTGLVMTKYSAFCQARLSIFDIVRRFEYGAINHKLDKVSFNNYTDIAHIASTLLYLKHRQAGESALGMFKEVADTRMSVEMYFRSKMLRQPIPPDSVANIDFETVAARAGKWQEQARLLKPNIWTLFNPVPHL